ncbi:hypothetical protein AT6N2_C2259 [Agrobacterium tumefaciens]|nr:hypothetical protein AT6N2_C2259 [Agrobacterium tumefaciens]
MAFQKCTHAAMADKGDWLLPVVSVENGPDSADDPRLRVDRPLPALITLLRMGEGPVRRLLEFRRRQEAGGGPVVFMHHLDDLYSRTGGFCEDTRGFDRLGFSTGNDAAQRFRPRQTARLPCPFCTLFRKPPFRNRDGRIDLDLWVGDVERVDGYRSSKGYG